MRILQNVLAQLECILLLSLVGSELLHPLLVGSLVDSEYIGLLRREEVWSESGEAYTDHLLVSTPTEDINDVGSTDIVLVPINRLDDHFRLLFFILEDVYPFFPATR